MESIEFTMVKSYITNNPLWKGCRPNYNGGYDIISIYPHPKGLIMGCYPRPIDSNHFTNEEYTWWILSCKNFSCSIILNKVS